MTLVPDPREKLKTQGHARSNAWPHIRGVWLKTHGKCECCGTALDLQVHHKFPFHLKPKLELDPTNFITLCEHPGHDCHFIFGHGYDWKQYNPQVEASLLWWQATLRKMLK